MTPEFEELFDWCGSPVNTCGCGRTHFTASGDNMDEGELIALNAKAKLYPDRYTPDAENHSVSSADIAGKHVVWGCKCGHAERVEAFLWDNRDRFLRYYRARIERAKKEAEATAAELSKINFPAAPQSSLGSGM